MPAISLLNCVINQLTSIFDRLTFENKVVGMNTGTIKRTDAVIIIQTVSAEWHYLAFLSR